MDNNNVVISEDGSCPYCKHQKKLCCSNCKTEVPSKIKTLCIPEKRIDVWKWTIFGVIVWVKKCPIPGMHFHVKCKTGSSECFGTDKKGKKCGFDASMGQVKSDLYIKRYNVEIDGCGGTWIDPVDKGIKQIDMRKMLSLMESEGKFEDLLK